MVTFYNDLNNMEDEYRNAKLNWIEKEANYFAIAQRRIVDAQKQPALMGVE